MAEDRRGGTWVETARPGAWWGRLRYGWNLRQVREHVFERLPSVYVEGERRLTLHDWRFVPKHARRP
jgi:hypothetical protein